MSRTNPWKREAQKRRAEILERAIDALSIASLLVDPSDPLSPPLNPRDQAVSRVLLDVILAWKLDDQWTRLAISCGMSPPSQDTVDLVLAAYRDRAGLPRLTLAGKAAS